MAAIDPLNDFKDIIFNNYNTGASFGGTKPTIAITQDYRTLDYKIEYIVLESLAEGDAFNGIGAVDYKRDIGINVHIWTTTDRARARQIVEEVRRVLRTKANWRLTRADLTVVTYDNVAMSVTRDLSDEVRKLWHFSFDITAWHFENV